MGELVTQQSIFKLRRYQALLTQMQTEMSAYNLWAADYIARGQMRMGVIGVSHAAEAVNLALLQGGASGVGTFFDTLPISAIQLMIGNAGKGGPVYTLLQENYPTAVERMTNILINNVAMGMSPMVTAKQMMAGMAGGLSHALTVARTEQMRVYREASRQQYELSGAVQEYMRFASKSGNTCALCLALDGEIYKSSELMSVHPNDRCVMIPVVNGVKPPQWESGEDWLKRQDEVTQKQILGPGAQEMWKNGDIELMDLVKKVEHPTWGPSLQRNTLASLREERGLLPSTKPSEFGPNESMPWVNTLSESEHSSFLEYKESSYFINENLRNGLDVDTQVYADIDNIQNALSRSVVDRDLIAYRGGTLPRIDSGATIKDMGFMSTTLNKEIAEEFLEDALAFYEVGSGIYPTNFKVIVPKGTNGAFIDMVAGYTEEELLLQAGTSFKVTSVNIIDDVQNVVLELIP